jgi:hypothetical protein
MKLTISTALAALVLSATLVASAKPDDRWVKVEGGSWVPTNETIAKIKEHIEPFVRTQAKLDSRELREWRNYTFQYQGQEVRGRKFVFVNSFCVNDDRWQLNKQMVLVLDGGTCFFNVKYDPKKNQFFELFINGEA